MTFRAPEPAADEPPDPPVPVLLLDVDGVLNAVTRDPDPDVWPVRREERPLVWVDDDLAHEREAVAWVTAPVPSRLLVAPASAVGLAPRSLREIEDFCALHAGAL